MYKSRDKICQRKELRIYIMKMNIKTNLLEEYVNSVDTTKKQKTYFKIFVFFNAFMISSFFSISYLNN